MSALRATYIGLDQPALLGKTALAMESYRGEPAPEGMIYLQFDDLELELDGVNLAHGWHAFRRDRLEVIDPAATDPEPCPCGCGLSWDETRRLDPMRELLDLSWQQWVLLYLLAVVLFLWWWASQKPARGLHDYQAGFHYVQLSLTRHGDSWETREHLWAEYERGMAMDPTHFEKGMRRALDSLVPLKP